MGQTGWDRYRERQAAVAIAAREAAAGRADRVDAALAGAGLGSAFRDRAELARYAQGEWWHRLLSQLDGDLDDDLDRTPVDERTAAAGAAWHALAKQLPGYLELASSCPATRDMVADRARFTRLLALFLGLARIDEPVAQAAAAGSLAALAFAATEPRRAERRRRTHRWMRRRDRADGKMAALRHAPALSRCTDADLRSLARAADLLTLDAGRALVTAAQPGLWWWMVLDGAVDVVAGGQRVRRLQPGEHLGPELPAVAHLAPVDLVASADTTVLVARYRDLEGLIHARPALRDALVDGGRAAERLAGVVDHPLDRELPRRSAM